MRPRALCVFFFVFSLPLYAKRHDWDNLAKLKPGSKISVELWSDAPVEGRFDSVSGDLLRVRTGNGQSGYQTLELPRERIRLISHIRGPQPRDPVPAMRKAALSGAAGGVTIGIVRDLKGAPGAGINWFVDGVAGAALGFFVDCGIAAGTGVVMVFRHNRVVYVDRRATRHFRLRLPPRNAP